MVTIGGAPILKGWAGCQVTGSLVQPKYKWESTQICVGGENQTGKGVLAEKLLYIADSCSMCMLCNATTPPPLLRGN